ncbi:MAG: amidohydrolase family protein [Planctomycetota bacterium]|jgi:imidazolonepropionase-like amidohydrolase
MTGILLLLPLLGATTGAEEIAIRAGTILAVSTNPIENGIVLIQGGKIRSVGSDVVVPSGARVIDAKDKFVVPGLVDAQSRLYVTERDLRNPGKGAPELTIIDALDPFMEGYEEVLAQGVTAVYVAPSGQGVFAGRGAVLKLNGAKTPKDLVLKADVAVRGSIGVSSNNESSSLDRLDDYANLREMLIETQAYMQRQRQYKQELAKYEKEEAEQESKNDDKPPEEKEKEKEPSEEKKKEKPKRPTKPKPNPTHEILKKVLQKEIPLQIEAHRVPDILNALRLAGEFDFSLILDKCTEGYLTANEIARRKVPVILGPVSASFVDMPKLEYRNHSLRNAAALADSGVQTAIGVSGRDGLSSKFVALAGAMAAANGMDKHMALRAVTLTPAEILGVADRIGSLDVGKDADLVIMSGHPFDTASRVEMVLIEGKTVYERKATP